MYLNKKHNKKLFTIKIYNKNKIYNDTLHPFIELHSCYVRKYNSLSIVEILKV